jgi:hypothetical protein
MRGLGDNGMTRMEQNLIDCLACVAGSGTFEAHVTVAPLERAAQDHFRAVCRELGVKSVLIELPGGSTPSQPMTSSYHRGELSAVAHEVADLSRSLRQHGFAVTRIKVEAMVGNAGVPETDAEARALPAGNYFEFHVKVSLPSGADLAPLRELVGRHQAHLSSNAFQREALGEGGYRTQWFVTLRAYGCGRGQASARFEALLADLAAQGYALSNRLREYTVYDSNVAVDAGWIDLELEMVPELEEGS